MFNEHCHRDFFSNSDYARVGGRQQDIEDLNLSQSEDELPVPSLEISSKHVSQGQIGIDGNQNFSITKLKLQNV